MLARSVNKTTDSFLKKNIKPCTSIYFVVLKTYLNICALNYKFIPPFVNNSCYMRGSEPGSNFVPLLRIVLEKNPIYVGETKLFPLVGYGDNPK
jgi:hypothetical protein